MGLLNRIRDAIVDDTDFFALAAREIESGVRRDGLWAKAMTEANFDDGKARAIYMRSLVKVMQKERRVLEDQAAAREAEAMNTAFSLYDQGRYLESLEGITLLVKRKHDELAFVCMANMAWHGLCGEGDLAKDRPMAEEWLQGAENSTDHNVRRYLGIVYESTNNWQKALESYDFATSKGNADAAARAITLRRRLKQMGVLPKTFIDKIFG